MCSFFLITLKKVLSVDKLTMIKLYLVFVSGKKKRMSTGFYCLFLSLRKVFIINTK